MGQFAFDQTKEYSFTGYFWHSGDDVNDAAMRLSGTLKYTPEHGFKLHIVSDQIDITPILLGKGLDDKFDLHGFVEVFGSISLIGCKWGPTTFGTSDISVVQFGVSFIIKGIHTTDDAEIFTGISFHSPALDHFFDLAPDNLLVYNKKTAKPYLTPTSISGDINIEILNCGTPKYLPLFAYTRNEDNTNFSNEIKDLVMKYSHKGEMLGLSKAYPVIKLTGSKQIARQWLYKSGDIKQFFAALVSHRIYADTIKLWVDDKTHDVFQGYYPELKTPDRLKDSNRIPIRIGALQENFRSIYNEFQTIMQDNGFSLLEDLINERIYKQGERRSNTLGYMQFSWIDNIICDWQQRYGANKTEGDEEVNFLTEHLNDKIFGTDNPTRFCDKVAKDLQNIFGDTDTLETIGWKIRQIRNCLEHKKSRETHKKPELNYESYKHIIENQATIYNLCELLFVVMKKVLYSKIGIVLDDDQWEKFVNSDHLPLWTNR
jgi:hypothetical protein